MTNEEFDETLKRLGLKSADAAGEMARLGGGKTTASYISAMRGGRKKVSQAAAIYARMKSEMDRPLEEYSSDELLDEVRDRLT